MTQPGPDMALLRFLRARVDELAVLNTGAQRVEMPADVAGELMRHARRLLPAGCGVPYAEIAASPAFADYRQLTYALRGFDPTTLQGRRERTAFWINIYNALVIDAVISLGVRATVRESPGFFHRAAYQIGPYRLALDEIEHGLLRDNRPQFPRLPLPFSEGDRRAALGPGLLDPRVHFALNCGTRSCPPVAFYEAAHLDAQLDAAASSFINAEGARLEGDTLVLSPLFEFYAEDFGGTEGARTWALRYVTDPAVRAHLEAGAVRVGEYDWALNV